MCLPVQPDQRQYPAHELLPRYLPWTARCSATYLHRLTARLRHLFRFLAEKHPGLYEAVVRLLEPPRIQLEDRKSTRLNSSHTVISYAVFCLKKKKKASTASA